MSDFQNFNRNIIEEFRQNNGKTTGVFANAPLLLLTTTGAKSGNQRTSPLVYTLDGDSVVVIASKGGSPTHPAWYHNLVAHPEVVVELPGDTFTGKARVAEGDERQRLFDAQAALMPNFNQYQANTTRRIPVIVIDRLG